MVQRDLIDGTPGPWTAVGLYLAGLAGGIAVMCTAAAIGDVGGEHRTAALLAGAGGSLVVGVVVWLGWRWLRPLGAGLGTIGLISAAAILLAVAAFSDLTF